VVLVELRVGRLSESTGRGWFDEAEVPAAGEAATATEAALRLTVPKFCNFSLDTEYVSCADEFVVLAPTALDPDTIAVHRAPTNTNENNALRITTLLA
jgi:hypothetical protein